MAPFPRSFCRSAALVLAGVLGGCVTERELREASELRRPEMPSARAQASAVRAPPAEPEILATALQHARTGEFATAAHVIGTGSSVEARERLARASASALFAADPAAAVALALQLPPGFTQEAALREVAELSVGRDPGAALQWALGLRDAAAQGGVRRFVAESLVATGPVEGMARLMAAPADSGRDEMLGFAAAAWARREPDAAGGWLRGLTDAPLQERLAASVGFEIAQTHPAHAIPYAEMLPKGRNRWLLFTAITQTWIAVDSRAAFAWTNQLPAGEPREAAIAGIDAGLGIAVARRMTPPPDTGGATGRAGGRAATPVVGDDPAFAAWLATQSGGMPREVAILEYVRQRSAAEPQVIGQWLVGLPGGPTREEAIEIFWRNLISLSSTEAARWLRMLPRSDRTSDLAGRLLREWLRADPDAAEAWLRESSLPGDPGEARLRAGIRR